MNRIDSYEPQQIPDFLDTGDEKPDILLLEESLETKALE